MNNNTSNSSVDLGSPVTLITLANIRQTGISTIIYGTLKIIRKNTADDKTQ